MRLIEFNGTPNVWDDRIRGSLKVSYQNNSKREIEDIIKSNFKDSEYKKQTYRDGGSIEIQFLSDEAVDRFAALIPETPQLASSLEPGINYLPLTLGDKCDESLIS